MAYHNDLNIEMNRIESSVHSLTRFRNPSISQTKFPTLVAANYDAVGKVSYGVVILL